MVNQQKRQEIIEVYRQGAESWRSRGNVVRETKSLSSLLMNYLAIAVLECGNSEEANLWSANHQLGPVLERYACAMQLLVEKVDSGEVPPSTISGNYSHLVFVHFFWSLNKFSLGEACAGIASRQDVLELSTPFWREYSRAIEALVASRPYTTGKLELNGQEVYWNTYLHLIELATNGQDISTALAEIDEAFARRNSDRSIVDDAHEIEGSGEHPVRWDFRRDGLVRYIQSGR